MLIAKLCKEGDCHNSAGGQNDPEPPLPLVPHLSIVHSVQSQIFSEPIIICPDDVAHLSHSQRVR